MERRNTETTNWRMMVLRANAVFLGVASIGGLVAWDVPGIFYGSGPEARVLGSAPYAGIGFLEAHGLAFILSVLLWRATPTRAWHVAAGVAEALLAAVNLTFWEIFSVADALPAGYISTALHLTFVGLHVAATFAAPSWVQAKHERNGLRLSRRTRRALLRMNALFLGIAGTFGFIADLMGRFVGIGPQATVFARAPLTAVGFLEAHGLVLILAALLWRASSSRAWHLTAFAVEALLGIANIACWEYFVASNALAGGYVTTILHWSFATAHLMAITPARSAVSSLDFSGSLERPQ